MLICRVRWFYIWICYIWIVEMRIYLCVRYVIYIYIYIICICFEQWDVSTWHVHMPHVDILIFNILDLIYDGGYLRCCIWYVNREMFVKVLMYSVSSFSLTICLLVYHMWDTQQCLIFPEPPHFMRRKVQCILYRNYNLSLN